MQEFSEKRWLVSVADYPSTFEPWIEESSAGEVSSTRSADGLKQRKRFGEVLATWSKRGRKRKSKNRDYAGTKLALNNIK